MWPDCVRYRDAWEKFLKKFVRIVIERWCMKLKRGRAEHLLHNTSFLRFTLYHWGFTGMLTEGSGKDQGKDSESELEISLVSNSHRPRTSQAHPEAHPLPGPSARIWTCSILLCLGKATGLDSRMLGLNLRQVCSSGILNLGHARGQL